MHKLTNCSLVLAGMVTMVGHASARDAANPNSGMVSPQANCEGLRGVVIDPGQIGVRSGVATVTDATAENELSATGTPTPYCKVLGTIAPLTQGASAIHFEVNLPSGWNRKFVMTGGGGFNGILLGGLGPLRDFPNGATTPMARGYVTASTDSGHQVSSRDDPEPARFALNEEMFRNFAYEGYKKTSDVARAVMKRYYGLPVRYSFYFGGSEGGREGVTMAQRYPRDFNGIVSVVPVISWTGLMSNFAAFLPPQRQQNGTIGPDQARLIASKVMASCDALDGIKDGAVSNYLGCHKAFSIESLICAPGQTAGTDCLSEAQIATLKSAYEPTTAPVQLVRGSLFYPGRLSGGEVQTSGDNLTRWLSTGKVPSNPLLPTDPRGVIYGSNFIRYVIARDPAFPVETYDPVRFASRLKEVSEMMDSTDPDLTPFFKAGGKLILRENAADSAQSPAVGFAYYQAVVDKLGQSTTDRFLRLYVSPSSSHGGAAFSLTTGAPLPTEHDLLADIDAWATVGHAPADALLQTSTSDKAPFVVRASRPLCRYPEYPHFNGGDQALAASYTCRKS